MWGDYTIEQDLNADTVGRDMNKGKANGGMSVSNVRKIKVLLNGKKANAYMANNRIVMQADELLVFGSGGFNPETRCFEIELKK